MSVKIQIKRANASAWTAANPTLAAGEWGMELDTKKLKLGTGALWNATDYYSETLTLNSVGDVTITSLQNGDFLRYSSSASAWINDPVNLSTDTVGDYVQSLVAGTGVTLSNNTGEGATPTVAIGQAVSTSSSVTFAHVSAPVTGNVTGNLTGNAGTATTLQTPRTISLSGDVSGSVSFNGSANVDIAATVQPNSVALGTDTTGNYMSDLTQGTGVTITHTPGEGSNATIAIGQAVATSSSVTFAQVSAPVTGNLTGNASTATTLETGRTIALSGDVSGSVSFNGSADATISAIIQPNSVALGTDTTGNYVNDITQGTGVTVTHTPGEGSSPTIAIGQAVGTSASVTFARLETTGNVVIGGNLTVNGDTTTLNTETLSVEDNTIVLNSNATGSPTLNAGIEVERGDSANVSVRWNESTDSWELTEDGSTYKNIAVGQDVETSASVTFVAVTAELVGNSSTSSALKTPRTIALSGDVSGSVSFDGSANVDITATVQPNSVALGTDTTGNYVNDVTAGTGVTVTHTPGEGTSPTIAIGQAVGTSASVTFANVTADLVGDVTGNASTASALETSRTISLTGDVSGSVSFNGSADANITATIQPNSVALGTDTTGNYMSGISVQNGLTVSHTPGEGSTATIGADNALLTNYLLDGAAGNSYGLIGTSQYLDIKNTNGYNKEIELDIAAVKTQLNTDGYLTESSTSTLTNKTLTSPKINENVALTATATELNYVDGVTSAIQTQLDNKASSTASPVITLAGDLSGSATFTNLGNATLTATIQPNSVALGTDTTGNYVNDITAGTGVSITHTPSEGSSPTVAIGQSVATSASVTFAKVDTTGDITVGGNLTVNGTTTTLNTETLAIEDNIVVLNSNVTGSPATNAGIEVERGDSANVVLRWNESTDKWETTNDGSAYSVIATNGNIALGTDTTGNYVNDLTAGTGVTVTHTPGEGSSPTVAIGQAVGTSSSVQFAAVTAPLIGNASTATTLATSRTIELTGDVTGSVSFDGSANASISATIAANSVALGTDTTGNYVNDLTAGTGVTVTHTPGEGTSPTVAIGQAVGTSASVTFAAVTAPVIGNASTASTLETARTISLTGDVSGSVSFNGSADASISATIQPNSVALGTDTTGNYVNDLTAGTGVTVTHTPGEGSSPTVAIGQAVGTSSSVTFAAVTAPLIGNASTATTLQTARTIAGQSFDGSANISIAPTDLTGVTSTAAELNILDGATLSTTELNYVDGVTSAIQTQIDAKAPSASPTFTGTVTLAADPSSALQAATKQYVDNIASGVHFHASVVAATTGNLAGTYDNGTAGVGATLTKATNGSIGTIDGASVVVGNRILVKSQTDSKENGIYTITAVGSVSAPWVVTRATDADNNPSGELAPGDFSFVTGGSTNAGYGFINNSATNPIVIGTDNITYTVFNAAQVVTSGAGLAFDGNILNVGTADAARIVVNANNIDLATTGISAGTYNSLSVDVYGRVTSASVESYAVSTLHDIGDVTAPSPSSGDFLKYNGAAWVNDPINLGTDTVGNFVNDVTAGTGVTVTHTPAEGSSPTIAIGQAVGTSSSVQFAAVTAPLIGNASTATTLATSRTIQLTGDVTGSVSFNGSADASINATIAANSVALGTDTTGNYVADVVSGTGITISHTPGEGSSASVALNATLDDLSNVTAPSPADGNFLKYVSASAAWVPAAVPTINALDDIGNVNAPSPTDGQVLKYVSASAAWVAADATGGAAAPTTTSITANTATTIDSFALATYRSAEFTIQVTQGSKYTTLKALVVHDGTTPQLAQYGIIEIGSPAIALTLSSVVSGSNVVLQATITDAATTNATVKVLKTTL